MSLEAAFRLEQGGFRLDAGLSAPPGVTALFGPSGCGKTTLLRCIAGLERGQGHCRLDGQAWQDQGLFLPPHRRPLGYVFQDARLFEHLTVAGNLRYGARRRGGGRFDATVELLDLGPLLTRWPAGLSGGERQRVALGRALLSAPRLLLLDEPLAALDAARKAEILPYLEALPRELALPVVYVTHALDEVVRLADRVALMDAGRTLASGPTAEMLARLDLPLAHRDDASALLPATVAGHDEAHQLTSLLVGGLTLRLPRLQGRVGEAVRLRVQARDVSLALERPGRTSILNVLPATVAAIGPARGGQRVVRLALEGGDLLARISDWSCAELELAPGVGVFAQVKGAALA